MVLQAVVTTCATVLGAAAGVSQCSKIALVELAMLLRAHAAPVLVHHRALPEHESSRAEDANLDADSGEYTYVYVYEYTCGTSESEDLWIGREREKGLWHNRNSHLWANWLEEQALADAVEGSGQLLQQGLANQALEVADGDLFASLQQIALAVS